MDRNIQVEKKNRVPGCVIALLILLILIAGGIDGYENDLEKSLKKLKAKDAKLAVLGNHSSPAKRREKRRGTKRSPPSTP